MILRNLYRNPPWMDKEYMDRMSYKLLAAIREKVGIFSTSKTNKNILMWSHYANYHQGICIGFDSIKIQRDTMATYGEVIYAKNKKMPVITPKSGNDLSDLLHTVNIKSKDWKYEREVRFFNLHLPSNIATIQPDSILSVTFGSEMKPIVKRELFNRIKRDEELKHVKIYSAQKKPKFFDVIINLYNEKYSY